jgi:two-component system chemotaxis sensor kinase CheA
MEELINEFIAETREMLEALGGEIVAWEAAPGDRARLDEIFRFVHTVKGNCGFFDLPRLETLSHAAEDALAEVRSGKRTADERLVSGVLAVIDRIGELVQALETGEAIASADDRMLIDALREQAAPPEAAVEAGSASFEARRSIRSIRLSVDLLDRMMSGVSDMVLARNELSRRLREAPADAALEAAFERVSACIGEMRDSITRTRMQRIDNLFVTLPRMVRDLGAELGKQVNLEIEGGDVELDREMIEMIRDPLTHIVRNAIDHGIEPAAERLKAGKSASGHLRICARQSGNQILLEIGDDGRGIDGERLLRRAVAAGLYSAEQAERLTPAQRTALMFEAGLSTAQEVTAISGRGVGMDVVRANIERIGGVVDVESRVGEGVRLTLRVPLTLTIIPALTVSAGGQVYAIPRSAIEEIVRTQSGSVRVERLGGSLVVTIRERRMPLVLLSTLLGADELPDSAERRIVVLKPAGGDLYAVGVDLVHDHEELVIKPASPLVMAAGLYAGTTLSDDGSPVLLLDPSGIASCAGIVLDQKDVGRRAADSGAEPAPEGMPALLFRTLDGVKRAISLAVVQRIEEVPADSIRFSAGRARVVIGDEILTLARCGAVPPSQPVRILRLSDGRSELAYAFAEVADIVSLSAAMKPAAAPGEVCGVTLVGSEQVEVLDPFWLFAAHGCDSPAAGAVPICAIPADDPWMQNILRPIVESAGYRVVDAGGAGEFDVLIAAADAPVDGAAAPEVIRLRATAEAPQEDGSIYRYDRAALLSALGARASAARKG